MKMKTYQQFVLVAVLGVVVALLLRDMPWWLVLGAAVFTFLMTLDTTWVIASWLIQRMGAGIGKFGHTVIGGLGDWIAKSPLSIKEWLRSAVPPWDDLNVSTAVDPLSVDASPGHEVVARPHDEGVDIFKKPQVTT